MYPLLRRLLFLLPPEPAHHLALGTLSLLEGSTEVCRWMRQRATPVDMDLSVEVAGLRFPNPIGLAAGLDKDAEAVAGLFALGFGAVEVGTVTPRPQPGNPAPRLFRLPEHSALINRMGFNNAGADAAAGRLRELSYRPAPLGINIGKNKDTPLERALEDYVVCVDRLAPWADYVVVNASSPNTPGLRQLQAPENLAQLLSAVSDRLRQVAPGKPLFLKIAPDLTPEAVDAIVGVALEVGISGLIATNTTVSRPFEHRHASETGGLSGLPVRAMSTEVVRRAAARAQGKLALIAVGGVFTADDVYEKLRAGASLVQVYTGFIYEGPAMVSALLTGLVNRLRQDGFSSLAQMMRAR